MQKTQQTFEKFLNILKCGKCYGEFNSFRNNNLNPS